MQGTMPESHDDAPLETKADAPLQQPSQDPRSDAQEPLSAAETDREVKSVAMGGGAIAGAAGGAAVGTAVAGPAGTLVGGLIGLMVGAVGGYAAVDAADPEYTYWQDAYRHQPDYVSDYGYEDYAPAYRLGYQGRQRYPDTSWEDNEATLERDWQALKGDSRLSWEQARAASRAAWNRQHG